MSWLERIPQTVRGLGIGLLCLVGATSASASVKIGSNASLPFQFYVDANANTYTAVNMTALNGASGLYLTKLNSAGKSLFSARLGYNVSANPFYCTVDSSGNSIVVSSMTALNGLSGLYLTKVNSTGSIVFTVRMGTNPSAGPFSCTVDAAGNTTVIASFTNLSGYSGLFVNRYTKTGGATFSTRMGTSPATYPFSNIIDGAGNVYVIGNYTSLSGRSGLYLVKLNSVGAPLYTDLLGFNPAANPFGFAVDGSSNSIMFSNMTSGSGVTGMYVVKLNSKFAGVYVDRIGINPASIPYGASIDTSGNVYLVANMSTLSGVFGLFMTKINPNGVVVYSGRLGYNPLPSPFAQTIDGSQNLFTVANMTSLNGTSGLYFSKINSTGGIVYNDLIGYSPASAPFDARLDASGNAYTIANMTNSSGASGLFVTKLKSTGTVVFSDRLGYSVTSAPFASTVDLGLNTYVTSNLTSANNATGLTFTKINSTGGITYNVRLGTNPQSGPFANYVDTSGSTFNLACMTSLTGNTGLFANRLSATGTTIYSQRLGTNPGTTSYAYYIDATGNAYVAGNMTSLTGNLGFYVSKLNASGVAVF